MKLCSLVNDVTFLHKIDIKLANQSIKVSVHFLIFFSIITLTRSNSLLVKILEHLRFRAHDVQQNNQDSLSSVGFFIFVSRRDGNADKSWRRSKFSRHVPFLRHQHFPRNLNTQNYAGQTISYTRKTDTEITDDNIFQPESPQVRNLTPMIVSHNL